MSASDFSVIDAADGRTPRRISTPFQDAGSYTVVMHQLGYALNGVVVPVIATAATLGFPVSVLSTPGNIGTNRSTNSPPNIPSVNDNSAASTTTATLTWNGATGLVILAVFPANPNRLQADIVNTTGSEIVLAIDDGSGGNLSMLPLDPSAPFGQGGSDRGTIEKGRIRVFGPTGGCPYAREN